MSMATVATVAAIGSGVATVYAANKASNSANKAIDAQAEATARQDQLSREAFDWYKQEYARTQPARDAAEKLSGQIAETQLGGMRIAMDQAQDQANYAKEFRPLERQIIQKALTYDTPERREAEAGRAMAGVQQQADAQKAITMRSLTGMGVSPESGRFAAVNKQLDARTALSKVAAGDTARRTVEQGGTARMMDAAGIGRGVISNQATMLAAANNGGNSAMGNTVSGINAAMSGTPLMTQGFNTAIAGANNSARNYAGMADVFNNQAANAIKGFGNFMQGMGSLGWKPLG